MKDKQEKAGRPKALRLLAEAVLLLAALTLAAAALRFGYHRYMRAAYPIRYSDYVEAYAGAYGFTPSLVYAVIRTESEFEPEVVSRANAKGLMQMKDTTFTDLQRRAGEPEPLPPESLFDPETSIRYGVYYMRLLLDQFEDTDTMLAAYNAGPGTVGGWLEDADCSRDGKTLYHIPYEETLHYVERVRKAQEMYRTLYDLE